MIKDIKSKKDNSACKAYGQATNIVNTTFLTFKCNELYYYLIYFQPEYLEAKSANNDLDSILSYI